MVRPGAVCRSGSSDAFGAVVGQSGGGLLLARQQPIG